MTRERHYIPESRQREKPKSKYFAIGHSMKRVEDTRLLTGSGTYADDVMLPNMAHAAVLRSPHAHARIVSIDKSKAEALPGVLCVMTGAEAAEVTGPCADFSSPPTPQYCIAVGKVRHVGEAVAAVVAESRYIAEDACELIEVEYDPLPAVVDLEEAVTSTGDAVLHPERGDTNVALQRTINFGTVDEDFAAADLVIERRLRWPRSGGTPIETVGATAHYDRGTGKFTIHANTSMYNYVGWLIAVSLKVDPHRLNIVPTDAGGSFGSKLFCHKVCTLAGTLARAAGRPVKYLEDRIDNMTSGDAHGSDRLYDAKLALKRDGTMLSMRLKVIDDYGAYFQYGVGQHGNAMAQVTGPYKINSVEVDLTAVLTNKCQQGAYRGFGSEVGNFVIERLVDAACEELGIDPVEMRRLNLIEKDQFPYIMPTGNMYDSGNYQAVLDEALGMIDYDGWRKKQAEAREEGRYIGIGISTCQERSVFSATEFWMWNPNETPGFTLSSSPESVAINIDPTGKAFITLNAPFWGNSPETMAVQVLAEKLEIDPGGHLRRLRRFRQGLQLVGAGRQPVHGDDRGCRQRRRRRDQGEDAARRQPHAGGGPERSRVPRGLDRRPRRARQGEDPRRGGAARPLLQAGPAGGPRPHQRHRRGLRLRPSGHDHAVGGSFRPRHLLPDRRPHVSHPGGRGGYRDRKGRLPRLRGGPRLRHHGQPDDARRPRAGRHRERHRQRPLRALPL